MAVWSQQLPNDLLSFIGNKLDVVADRCRFRSVCKSWRCSLPPFAQPPFLMLSEPEEKVPGKEMVSKVNRNPTPLRGFVSGGGGGGEQQQQQQQQQMVYEIDLPEAHQHRCVGSTGNWLITTDKSGMMYLLNPFSKNQINLPPQSTFEYGFRPEIEHLVTPEDRRDFLLSKVIISSPSSNSPDCIAMAIHHGKRKLAVARLGDTTWTTVQTPLGGVDDVIFFKEQFYAVTYRGIVMVCDFGLDLDSSKTLLLTEILPKATVQNIKYLVELLGELILIIKFISDPEIDDEKVLQEIREKNLQAYKTEMFEVYKLDFTSRKWKEVNNLGKHCLFLGFNTSVSVLADNYFGLQGNCIYFTDDYVLGYRGIGIPGGKDMGVFNLEDKSIQPHYKGESTSYYSPPIWLVPTPGK